MRLGLAAAQSSLAGKGCGEDLGSKPRNATQ